MVVGSSEYDGLWVFERPDISASLNSAHSLITSLAIKVSLDLGGTRRSEYLHMQFYHYSSKKFISKGIKWREAPFQPITDLLSFISYFGNIQTRSLPLCFLSPSAPLLLPTLCTPCLPTALF